MNKDDKEKVFDLLDNADRKVLSVALEDSIANVTRDIVDVGEELREFVGLDEECLFIESEFEDLTRGNRLYLVKGGKDD